MMGFDPGSLEQSLPVTAGESLGVGRPRALTSLLPVVSAQLAGPSLQLLPGIPWPDVNRGEPAPTLRTGLWLKNQTVAAASTWEEAM